MNYLVITILMVFCFLSSFGQTGNVLTIDQAVEQALKNNPEIKASGYEVESRIQLKKTSIDLPKTEVMLMYGQYNSYAKDDNNITVSQVIPFTALGSQRAYNKALINASEIKKSVTENDVVYNVKQTYQELSFLKARKRLLLRQDSIFGGFLKSSALRYKTGESNLLEQTTAEAQYNEGKNQLRKIDAEIFSLQRQLQILINASFLPDIPESTLTPLAMEATVLDTVAYKTNPALRYSLQQVEVTGAEKRLQSARFAPDFHVGFFSQTLVGAVDAETGAIASNGKRCTGFQLGISLPVWFAPHQGRVRAAAYSKQAAETNYEYHQRSLQGQLEQATQKLLVNKSSLDYYEQTALPNSELILKQSQLGFQHGEINYTEYLMGIRNALSIQENYYNTLNEYNQSVIYIQYLTGNR
ncbi:TolC family protein [Chryseosolibacter indicus]|uniref:TolC family protein n=1 Tax=Chryseosolibacter indicus TaxID=2782351 RepID=UPI00345F91C6